MSGPAQFDDIEDKPLDPAIERIRRRMMRLMLVSVGIMVIGIMAVLYGIVFKLTTRGDAEGPAFDVLVPLPQGGRILSTTLAGDRLSVLIEDEAGLQSLLVLDARTGKQLGRFTFSAR
jgi:hypothetical protein